MKTVITWTIIIIALIIALIDAIYGNPARVIIYLGIIAFMWGVDKFQKSK